VSICGGVFVTGRKEWMEKMRALLSGSGARGAGGSDEIAPSISTEFGEPWKALVEPRGHPARALGIGLSRRHCSRNFSEIGERCSGSDCAAVSQAKHRMETTLRNNASCAAIAKCIAKHLPVSYVET
jgi:hypothetical protein